MPPKIYDHFVLGVSGAIESANTFNLVTKIKPLCAALTVIFTPSAISFSSIEAVGAVAGTTVLWDRNTQSSPDHNSLAAKTDFFLIAPSSANTIGKLAHGIGDNYLTAFSLCFSGLRALAPSMAHSMWMNSVVQQNIDTLKQHGFNIIIPTVGREVADLSEQYGAMPNPDALLERISAIRRADFTNELRESVRKGIISRE